MPHGAICSVIIIQPFRTTALAARFCNGRSAGNIFIEFVPKRPDRYAENFGSMGSVAEAMIERIHNQLLLDFADRFANE